MHSSGHNTFSSMLSLVQYIQPIVTSVFATTKDMLDGSSKTSFMGSDSLNQEVELQKIE